MPSNTMKISQLIERLQSDLATHGDVDCILSVGELTAAVSIDGRNINMATKLPFCTLPVPCLVFGLWQDQTGRLQASPGQQYQYTPGDESEWNHQRNEAPEATPLIVWKRYLGQDRGYRQGADWYVYEGGVKPVQIIPDGILGWKLAP